MPCNGIEWNGMKIEMLLVIRIRSCDFWYDTRFIIVVIIFVHIEHLLPSHPCQHENFGNGFSSQFGVFGLCVPLVAEKDSTLFIHSIDEWLPLCVVFSIRSTFPKPIQREGTDSKTMHSTYLLQWSNGFSNSDFQTSTWTHTQFLHSFRYLCNLHFYFTRTPCLSNLLCHRLTCSAKVLAHCRQWAG